MQRIVTFKIDEALLEALDEYARSRRLSRSEVIRKAIEELLRSEGVELPRRRGGYTASRGQVIEIPV